MLNAITLSLVDTLSARSMVRLREAFGDAGAILSTPVDQLERVVKYETAAKIAAVARQRDRAEEVFEICQRHRIDIVLIGDANYPTILSEIDDPPPVLYVRGSILPTDAFALAIVGTRYPTHYGVRVTEQLTSAVASSGMTVVSGLARGIDSVAHRAALAAGGRTIAVLGSGVLNVYPTNHGDLAEEIASRGAVVSEFPPHCPPAPWRFPQRNRIVSGLSLGVLVTEAPLASGTMITARLASEQGREVFAVPHPIGSHQSRGCHQLLRDHAVLTEGIDDIIGELGPMQESVVLSSGTRKHPAEWHLNDQELRVLAAIDSGAISRDALETVTELSPSQIAIILSVLESRSIVRFSETGRIVRL
ncbi:MAG: DNA-processing protein DprA [Thermoguttaceae bacterium]